MKVLLAHVAALMLALPGASAGSRSSANYSIPAESTDGSGARLTSANYAFNGSAIGEPGTGAAAIATSGDYANKPGFVGELYEIVALSITAPPSTSLNETAMRQLVAAPQADDSTTLAAFDPTTISWSIVNGPINSISTGGVATAGNVYQDTPGTIGGMALSLSGQLSLTILNVGFDDFQEYAADMIDDAWQVQYFGLPPNLLAGPNADASGTGQTNLFKFVAGLNPLDATSRFLLQIAPVNGQPGRKNLIFSPLLVDRAYVVKAKTSLTSGSYAPLLNSSLSDNGQERTVTDFDGSGAKKYYIVEITKP